MKSQKSFSGRGSDMCKDPGAGRTWRIKRQKVTQGGYSILTKGDSGPG